MRVDFYWRAYKYLPYEQTLAHRELIELMGKEPIPRPDGLSIDTPTGWKTRAYHTTYFREAVAEDGSKLVPLQAALEASANIERARKHYNMDMYPLLHRQSTRYSAHGIHEYRGKFNPQIVRVIGNIIGLQPEDWLLDPFCGCGTTLLEAAHIGWNAIGMDLNPLAVQIALAKIEAMRVSIKELHAYTETLNERLRERFVNVSLNRPFTHHQIQEIGAEDWQTRIPGFDFLRRWFKESVLVQLSVILDEISRLSSKEIQLIMRVILSDTLREVSLQDPADLRIRRRKSSPENAPAILLFLDTMTRKIETISRAREYIPRVTTIQDALLGDVRCCATIVKTHPKVATKQQFDAAITSPPYATALPYIDTQRLSLVLLGLIGVNEIRPTERSLIGTREITPRERLKIERAMETNADCLPSECISFCLKLRKLLDKNNDGFRRQNKPALVYKYLSDMALMFRQVHQLLRRGAPFALIVGRNKTRLGGKTLIIDNPRLLALLAEYNGFAVRETIELNTYQRFDIHQLHSIRSETLVILRAM